jgi:hypothetical protein
MYTETHEVIHEIVAAGNGIENRTNTLLALFRVNLLETETVFEVAAD